MDIYRPSLPATEPPVTPPGVAQDPLAYPMLLQRAAIAANQSSTLQQAAGLVVSEFSAHMGWPVGHLYVLSNAGDLVPGGISQPGDSRYQPLLDFLDRLTLRSGQALAGRVVTTGQPAWVTDIGSEVDLPWGSTAAVCGLNAALAFPVLVGGEVVAVLEFFAEQARPPDDGLVEVLRSVGTQLGWVVERRRGPSAFGEGAMQGGGTTAASEDPQGN
jgi:GAF domain-containing protein